MILFSGTKSELTLIAENLRNNKNESTAKTQNLQSKSVPFGTDYKTGVC